MRIVLTFVILAFFFEYAAPLAIKVGEINKQNINDGISNRELSPELNQTLECLRYALETGLPEYGLPSLVSLEIPDVNIDVESLGIDGSSGYFHISSGVVNGLTSFFAPELAANLGLSPVGLDVNGTIVFPNLYAEIDYDMDLVVAGVAAFGNGKIIVDWTDLVFKTELFLGLGADIYINDLIIYITIGSSEITITGWFNDEEHTEAINELVNGYLIPHWINGQVNEISEVVSPLLQDLVNSLLSGGEENGDGGEGGNGEGADNILVAILEHCSEFIELSYK